MVVSERIRNARLRAGLSKSELARRMGVSPQAVLAWEGGTNAPKPNRIAQLAEILGVSEVHLLGLDERDPSPDGGKMPTTVADRRSPVQIAGEVADRITASTRKGRLSRDDLLAIESIVIRLEDR